MARRARQSKTRQEPRTFNGMPTRVWIRKDVDEFYKTERAATDDIDDYDLPDAIGVYDLVEVLSVKKEIRIEKAAVPSTKVPKIIGINPLGIDPNAI